jgi:hypothetical protein
LLVPGSIAQNDKQSLAESFDGDHALCVYSVLTICWSLGSGRPK